MDEFSSGKDTEESFAIKNLFHEVLQAMQGKSLPDALKDASLEEILPLMAMEFLAAKRKTQKTKPKDEPDTIPEPKPYNPLQLKNTPEILRIQNFSHNPEVLFSNMKAIKT